MFHSDIRVEAGGGQRIHGPIVLAADAAYAMPLATTLRSLTENNAAGWPLDIHVIHDGMHEALRTRILSSLPPGSATICWHQIDLTSFASSYNVLPHISRMTYARFLLPRLLPAVKGKVLYLDSDILVLGRLDRLWAVDLEGAVIGAVLDPLDCAIKRNRAGLEGAPRVAEYFNAGVLLIDLAKWRSEHVSEKALDYLDRCPRTPYSDQDALNVALDGRWKGLSAEWNFQCEPLQHIDAIPAAQRPSIVHFVASLKPWKPGSLSVNSHYYDEYRARTRFARSRREYLIDELKRFGHRLLHHSAALRATWHYAKSALQTKTTP